MKKALMILLIFFGCDVKLKHADHVDLSKKDIVKESTSPHESKTELTNSVFEDVKFDIHKYKDAIDSVVNIDQLKKVESILKEDSIDNGKQVFVELNNTSLESLSSLASTIIKYRYIVNADTKLNKYNHNLIVFSFDEVEEADSIYTLAQELAIMKSGVPGLTYRNDYLMKQEEVIYWINSGCDIPYKNHEMFIHLLLSQVDLSLESQNAIYCKCGKVRCESKSLSK